MGDSRLRNHRILVVEDELLIATDLELALQAAQAIVLGPVAKVQDGLELMTDEPEISAAILDVKVAREMVFPVAEALLERSVPFLFATGEPSGTIPPRFAGVEVCRKPADPADLVRRVVSLLVARRAQLTNHA